MANLFQRVRDFFSQSPAATSTRSGFSGAKLNRLVADWVTTPLSADRDMGGQLPALRARSRDHGRNNPLARRYFRMVEVHVVGPEGFTLTMAARDRNGDLDRPFNLLVKEAWAAWGKDRHAVTLSGRYTWPSLQRLAARTWHQDGEVLVQKVRHRGNQWGFSCHILDADQLDYSYNYRPGPGQNEIRYGVEVDTFGRPVAYHVTTSHPSEDPRFRKRTRIPAADMIHLYDPERPNQTRGVPRLAAVMTLLRHLAGYSEAELVAARASAAKMGFIGQEDPNGTLETPEDGEVEETWEATPGTIQRLGANERFYSFDPTHPSGNYESYAGAVQREAATGLSVSYAGLTSDLRGANYSSLRAGLLEERDSWRVEQATFRDLFVRDVFSAWLDAAWLSNYFRFSVADLARAQAGANFRGRGWAWTDPVKDLTARKLGIELRVDSRHQIMADTGGDLETTLGYLEAEDALGEEYGISMDLPTTGGGANGQAPQPGGPNASGDGTDTGDGGDGSSAGDSNATDNGQGNG